MKRLRIVSAGLAGLALAAVVMTYDLRAASTGDLLQQGLYAEEVEGNMDTAIKTYGQIIQDRSASRSHVAQALYRQGMCYLKIKNESAARGALEKLVSDYSDQTEIVEKARPMLDDLTNFDPATLMPPETLVYVEFGSPGRQIETILGMLKGTPYENPLAAMGGRPASANNGEKSPADIMAALLNPSMLAEFKKIRSSAIGVTGFGDNPPMVAVLYPGKSDALRGIILAALGMGGTPSDPIEGMQTVRIQNSAAVAYDEKVVILTQPPEQLSWCVKQYKGSNSAPTLASSNKSFSKISRRQRQEQAVTLWASVDDSYARLLKIIPPDDFPEEVTKANALLDFKNIDDMIMSFGVEPRGLSSRAEVQFKEGHQCLVYDLVRTPNITRAPLGAVPAEAIALATFSLGEVDTARADKVRAKVQSLTGLDVGRELFANIEQVTLFAMPEGTNGATAGGLPGRLGLALTSRNPEQTRQVATTLLGTVDMVSGGREDSRPGRYKIGMQEKEAIYCYVEQVDGTTILSCNRSVVDASMAAIKSRKSALTSGAFSGALSRLSPTASKLVLVNVGGAVRFMVPQMDFGSLTEEQVAQLKKNVEQLAHCADAGVIEVRAEEQPDHVSMDTTVSGIPPLSEAWGPVMQIARLADQGRAEAKAQMLRHQTPALIAPVAKSPVIDGNIDDTWKSARAYPLENVIYDKLASSNDLTAVYRAMSDENNLYLLVDVTDETLMHNSSPVWHLSDGIEVYIDATNGKAGAYGQTDYLYAFVWDKSSPQMRETKHDRTNGVQYALTTLATGYRLEAKFPWSTIGAKPSAGQKIGLDVHVNDSDTSKDGEGKRNSKLTWRDKTDDAWQNPQAFGNAEIGGLIGWWKLDEPQAKIIKDYSAAGRNGVLSGNARWVQGKTGSALDLDGKNSLARIENNSAFDMADEMTLACWVNIRSVPAAYASIMTKGDAAWRLSLDGDERRFHFAVNDYRLHQSDDIAVNGGTLVSTGEWHHVAGVYNGRTIRLFLDGKLDGSKPWTGGIGKDNFEVMIGENAELPGRFFDGLIDDVRIYNHALPESEILALAGSGKKN